MQQNRGAGSDHQEMKQNHQQQQQDRRLKLTGDNQQQQHNSQPQHPPQKCPRCESVNTKFCYYNNYSLSQPRYFCKTCRRYWTQGGTLRNVPVGGGCRKGKRTKTTNSYSTPSAPAENSRSLPPQTIISSGLRTKDSGSLGLSSGISSMGPYYSGTGFLSSLVTVQSMSQPQAFNQPINQGLSMGGGDLGRSSDLGLLQGYHGFPSFGSQQFNPIQQSHFFDLGNRERISAAAAVGSSSSHQNWHQPQGFISGNNNVPTVSEAGLWSINENTNTSNSTVASLNPNQWPDLPGYGAPP